MSNISIDVPNLGESIGEAVVAKWLAKDGELVHKGDTILELESDKANVEIHAPETGILRVKAAAGNTVKIGNQVGEIQATSETSGTSEVLPPSPETVVKEKKMFLTDSEWVEETSPLEQAMARTLLKSRQKTVPATTYTDIDMSKIIAIRVQHKEDFKERFGVKLGYMSFFCAAVTSALREFPIMNARIHDNQIIFNKNVHLGIAVSREKGLVVPVLRNVNRMGHAEIEKKIDQMTEKASQGTFDVADLRGGTFTITNGGIFGSLFSTPLLNSPQVGILGMHRIDYRPVALKDENGVMRIEIRPMMYLALTYDHRFVEGKFAVQFLGRVKASLEQQDEKIIFQSTIE
ncbi:MAG: hypothetical protein A2X86_08405 [Bdellovibrionales bacterium GWA2_49_15]|nr:MAG: hypothetical protein A2X86_08405 [Bdellovibrionales bacterium GWA2_49_15]HAZ11217.1 dihydrolipoyllysine succinyltransferase [Bdellovibrionales bacterium]